MQVYHGKVSELLRKGEKNNDGKTYNKAVLLNSSTPNSVWKSLCLGLDFNVFCCFDEQNFATINEKTCTSKILCYLELIKKKMHFLKYFKNMAIFEIKKIRR